MTALVEQVAARWKAARKALRSHQHQWRDDKVMTAAFQASGFPVTYSTCRCGGSKTQGLPQ